MKGNEYIESSGKKEKPKKARKKWLNLKRPKGAASKGENISDWITGDALESEFVKKHLAYIFFIICLLVLVVSKGYYVKQLANDIGKTEEELSQITADYIEYKARLEEETKRINLISKLRPLGLKETVNPTKVIRIEKE